MNTKSYFDEINRGILLFLEFLVDRANEDFKKKVNQPRSHESPDFIGSRRDHEATFAL